MNWLDGILLLVIFLSFLRGVRHGLVRQVIRLTGLLLAFFLALHWYSRLVSLAEGVIPLEPMLAEILEGFPAAEVLVALLVQVIGFIILFIIIVALFNLFSSKLSVINRIPVLGFFNRLVGGLIGLVRGLILVLLIITLLSVIPAPFWRESLQESVVADFILSYLGIFAEKLIEMLQESLDANTIG